MISRARPMSDIQVKQTYTYRAFVVPPPASKKTRPGGILAILASRVIQHHLTTCHNTTWTGEGASTKRCAAPSINNSRPPHCLIPRRGPRT